MSSAGPRPPTGPLTPAQVRGLAAAQLAGQITAHEYAVITGRTEAAARADLTDLVARGVCAARREGRTLVFVPVGPAASALAEPA